MSTKAQAALYAQALASTPYAASHWAVREVEEALGISKGAAALMWRVSHGLPECVRGSEHWAAVEAEIRCPS